MTIVFENEGTLDPRSYSVFGLTAKETDNPIGFFGTGLKYAISVILREGGSIRIETETSITTFNTLLSTFRNKAVEHVVAYVETPGGTERIELPFTLELGKGWALWQAFRELYTNCLDEKGHVFSAGKLPPRTPPENITRIIVGDSHKFEMLFAQRDEMFIDPDELPAFHSDCLTVYARPQKEGRVYYRRMYTGNDLEHGSYFTYNVTQDMVLTEDRTLKDLHSVSYMLEDFWLYHMPKHKLTEILPELDKRHLEYHFNPSSWKGASDNFIEAVTELVDDERKVPLWAYSMWERHRPVEDKVKRIKMDDDEKLDLEEALAVLAHNGVLIDPTRVQVVESLPNDVFGLAVGKRIFITRTCLEKGDLSLIGTLYEEHIHIALNFADRSRAMQNHLIDTVAKFMRKAYRGRKIRR